MAKEIVQKATMLKKEFNYSSKDVNLNFTLSMENTSQLRAFHACLKEAIRDIEKIIGGMNN
jgi:hypothetical protein